VSTNERFGVIVTFVGDAKNALSVEVMFVILKVSVPLFVKRIVLQPVRVSKTPTLTFPKSREDMFRTSFGCPRTLDSPHPKISAMKRIVLLHINERSSVRKTASTRIPP
jgi:hypothetical protein